MTAPPVALVTGANRGLGRGVVEALAGLGYAVVLTSRTLDAAEEAATELRAGLPEGVVIVPRALDVGSNDDAVAVAAWVEQRFGRLDALVNNAGVAPWGSGGIEADPAVVLKTIDINALGALRVARAVAPLLRTSRGTIVNVSSGMGGLTEMGGGSLAYRMSKASLNVVTRVLHAELKGDGVRVNSVCPGWVRTDMGGAGATRSIAEGVVGIVWAVTLPPEGPSGGFYRDGVALAF